jgi:hypothetical protein
MPAKGEYSANTAVTCPRNKALIAGAAGILHVYQLDVGCAFEHLEPDVLRGAGAHDRQRQLARFCARGFDR